MCCFNVDQINACTIEFSIAVARIEMPVLTRINLIDVSKDNSRKILMRYFAFLIPGTAMQLQQ